MSSSRCQRPRFIPQLECLEDRAVPAGLITTTFANGVLTITGQDDNPAMLDQDIALLGGGRGHVSISQQDGETFSGRNSFNGVRQVIVRMNAGDDTVTFVDLRLPRTGNLLEIRGGEGNNNVFYDGVNIDINRLRVTSGVGNLTMAPTAVTASQYRTVEIEAPEATCNLVLGGMTVLGNTRVVTGETGNDMVEMDDNTHRGTFTLLTGGGNDSIFMGRFDQGPDGVSGDGEELTYQGAVTIRMGAGTDSLTAGISVHDPNDPGDDREPDFTRFFTSVIMDGGSDAGDTIEVHHPRSTEFMADDSPILDDWEVIVYNP